MQPYEPLDTPRPLAEDIWIVDGPVVRMRYLVGSLPFPTRMTVVRLPDGRLWLHSPTHYSDELAERIAGLGEPACLVAPNRLHWMALADWQAAFPRARTFAAPGVERHTRRGGFRIDETLEAEPPAAWRGEIDQVLVPGSFMTEAAFFHRASATLVLTDLIENFEPDRVGGFRLRLLMRLGGVLAPKGATPRDLLMTFLPHRAEVRRAAETMLGWAPERIVIAHGRMIEADAMARLRGAVAWTGATG